MCAETTASSARKRARISLIGSFLISSGMPIDATGPRYLYAAASAKATLIKHSANAAQGSAARFSNTQVFEKAECGADMRRDARVGRSRASCARGIRTSRYSKKVPEGLFQHSARTAA